MTRDIINFLKYDFNQERSALPIDNFSVTFRLLKNNYFSCDYLYIFDWDKSARYLTPQPPSTCKYHSASLSIDREFLQNYFSKLYIFLSLGVNLTYKNEDYWLYNEPILIGEYLVFGYYFNIKPVFFITKHFGLSLRANFLYYPDKQDATWQYINRKKLLNVGIQLTYRWNFKKQSSNLTN